VSDWLLMRLAFLIVFSLLSTIPLRGEGKLGERLRTVVDMPAAPDQFMVWIFLGDKGANEQLKAAVPHRVVSERSLTRRAKVRPNFMLVDYTDLPVDESYVATIAPLVNRVRHRSKWFNAVSVVATREQLDAVQGLAFVRTRELVARSQRYVPDKNAVPMNEEGAHDKQEFTTFVHSLDYGPSFNQLNQIGVPALHDSGLTGQGVTIGVFDNGFRLLNHESFASLNIAATYDFVDHKVDVAPNNPNPLFGSHGINVLSALGGYKESQLIGPAFGARFVLARTENDSSETPIEEDNWVAAIEWADSIGVDVTSTSLGYLDYDSPHPGWTWQDMDGNTTVITRAADMAAAKGILVFNSAGNYGLNTDRNTLIAPADGDSVVAVGAVAANGQRASFSSVGPTTSVPPRIKPDIMAQGVSVRAASGTSTTGYVSTNGTSLACPLAAGVGALLLEANPGATPMQILQAMKETASNASAPNNLVGWGIINAVAALGYLKSPAPPPGVPLVFELKQNYPNPFNNGTIVTYLLEEPSFVTLIIYDMLGRRIRTLLNSHPVTPPSSPVIWNGTNDDGFEVAGGVYLYRLTSGSASGVVKSATRKMVLLR
jgi:serine protease AprX